MGKLFISFEGMEGSGKSTQVGLLASRLKEEGYEITVVREPGGTRIGEHIRKITHDRENVDLTAAAESYLMAGSRAQLVREMIKPSLDAGRIVIADRFIDSSLAYQGYGRNLGEEEIFSLNHLALENIMPDVTFFLDIPPKVGLKRKNHSNITDRLDLQQQDFYERVYTGYGILAKRYKKRYIRINAENSIHEIEKNIWEKILKYLKKGG